MQPWQRGPCFAAEKTASFRPLVCFAALLVLLVIWVRPAPLTLYGADASCYALVAQGLAERPFSAWLDLRLGEVPFYEHPPGFLYVEALAFRVFGASTTTAVTCARILCTLSVTLTARIAFLMEGAPAVFGALLFFPLLSGFLFESQNPMLESPLCVGLLVAMLGICHVEQKRRRGCAYVALGFCSAFWSKGPPALAALFFLFWATLRRRISTRWALACLGLSLVCVGSTVLAFEALRAHAHLPPFFSLYGQHQVLPSLFRGRHNPQSSALFYAPVLWRWYSLGVLVALPACLVSMKRRQQAPGAARLVELALAWSFTLLFGFSLARQKYQWYVHPIAPSFAWLGGSLCAALPRASQPIERHLVRKASIALGALCALYAVGVMGWPSAWRTRRAHLDALYLAPAPVFRPAEPHHVAYCAPHLWREDHVARFLWHAELVDCDASAPYRFANLALTRQWP